MGIIAFSILQELKLSTMCFRSRHIAINIVTHMDL